MSPLDINTEDWTLWRLTLRSPHGFPLEVKVRAPSQFDAIRKALTHRPDWTVAVDANDVPLVWREEAR
jgi:hypothetical protein